MRRTFALCVLLFVAQRSANGQSDEKTDCSKMDFKAVPKDCCKTPFGDVFPTDKLATTLKACKSSAKLLEWANNYKINSLQQMDIKNFIDINNTKTIKELCSAGAFMECVFKKSDWLNDTGAIDIDALKTSILEATTSAAWKGIVEKTLSPLDPANSNAYPFTDILENQFEKITCTPGGAVNLQPLMMAQMLQSEFIWMCPQQNVYTSKNKCTETMKNYQFCDGKIYSTLAKGVFFFPSV